LIYDGFAEEITTEGSIMREKGGIKTSSRLRTRIAISYVGVSLVIVLGLLSIVSGITIYALTRTPVLAYLALYIADRTAHAYALQAALWAQGGELKPGTTFEPGQPASLHLPEEGVDPELSALNWDIPYVAPGSPSPEWPAFGLLIGPDEQIISSSYPDAYPTSLEIDRQFPQEAVLIKNALSGKSDYSIRENDHGRFVSLARTVWSQEQEPIGAVYMQLPTGGSPNLPLLAQVAWIVIPSGTMLLCLIIPVGVVFGVLTTRGVVRRIERLGKATSRFTDGDYSQRVPVSRKDEIGQLEGQFNQMAEQLVDSFEQRQALAEQSARREERARIDQEMSSAYYIQKSLLPKEIPDPHGWQLEPLYRPASQVGGDLYDFLALPDGKIGIVIGDANGKGMPAALIMTTTCAMLRAAAPGARSPGQALSQVNNLLHNHIPPMTFATCFYAILDPKSGKLCFANAGHNLPYLVHDGEVSELRATGMPLDLMPDQEYSERETSLGADDCLLFYSDGLVEAHNESREMFGTHRLMNLFQRYSNTQELIDILLNELDEFSGKDWEQEDDITLITLRRVA
jgi:serine phosphatase RsbU (regulator of sigma subunit)